MELLADSGQVLSMEVVELNPIIDERNVSALLAVDLNSLGSRELDSVSLEDSALNGSGQPAIEVVDLTMKFGDKVALDRLNLQVWPGEILGYLGPNGAGKSTTMKILTGQLQPTSGSATVLGLNACTEQIEIRRQLAYVPETGPLYDVLTAMETLELVGNLRELDPVTVRERARGLLQALELAHVADRPLWTYSRGMRQRVVLASAFLHEPKIVFLDEPLYGPGCPNRDARQGSRARSGPTGNRRRVLLPPARRGGNSSRRGWSSSSKAPKWRRVRLGELLAGGRKSGLEGLFQELTMDGEFAQRADTFLQVGGLSRSDSGVSG